MQLERLRLLSKKQTGLPMDGRRRSNTEILTGRRGLKITEGKEWGGRRCTLKKEGSKYT